MQVPTIGWHSNGVLATYPNTNPGEIANRPRVIDNAMLMPYPYPTVPGPKGVAIPASLPGQPNSNLPPYGNVAQQAAGGPGLPGGVQQPQMVRYADHGGAFLPPILCSLQATRGPCVRSLFLSRSQYDPLTAYYFHKEGEAYAMGNQVQQVPTNIPFYRNNYPQNLNAVAPPLLNPPDTHPQQQFGLYPELHRQQVPPQQQGSYGLNQEINQQRQSMPPQPFLPQGPQQLLLHSPKYGENPPAYGQPPQQQQYGLNQELNSVNSPRSQGNPLPTTYAGSLLVPGNPGPRYNPLY